MATVFGGPDVPVAAGVAPTADPRVSARASRSDTKNIAAPSERKPTPPHIRRSVLLAAAGATAVALAYALAPSDDNGVVVAAKESARIPAASTLQRAAAPAPVLSSAARAEIPLAATADPFVATSFAPPPPPAPVWSRHRRRRPRRHRPCRSLSLACSKAARASRPPFSRTERPCWWYRRAKPLQAITESIRCRRPRSCSRTCH